MNVLDKARLMEDVHDFCCSYLQYLNKDCDDFSFQLQNFIDSLPAVEAEPVQHGRWERGDNGEFACSVCGKQILKICGDEYFAPRCPNCGAKLDLKMDLRDLEG